MKLNLRRAAEVAAFGGVVGLILWWPRGEEPRGFAAMPGHVDESELDDAWVSDPSVVARAFLHARGAEESEEEGPRRRIWLCSYGHSRWGDCAEGNGAGLFGAVGDAAEKLGERIRPTSQLKLDALIGSEADVYPSAIATQHDLGVTGYRVESSQGQSSFVLPSEVFERGVTEEVEGIRATSGPKLVGQLTRRNAGIGVLGATFPYERIRTAAWLETPEGPQRRYRLHAMERPATDDLLRRATWAADHLVRTVAENGKIRYTYDPTVARPGTGQNLLRHAGTTMSLLEAYEVLREPEYLEASERAIGFLLENSATDRRGRFVVETSRNKLGGAGLGLLALATHERVTDSDAFRGQATEFATYLLSQQLPSGEFVAFAPRDPDGDPVEGSSAYYPGEAIVGLVAHYENTGEERWLDAAGRGARWLIEVRDAGKSSKKLANDHWLMKGLAGLYRSRPDDLWLRHQLALADAVAFQATKQAGHERFHADYYGGYYEPPRSTPGATRAEGLNAVLDLCDLAGEDCSERLPLLERTLQHVLWSQYTPNDGYWLADRSAVEGGLAGGVTDPVIRNDFTQHALSAMLGAVLHLPQGDVHSDLDAYREGAVGLRNGSSPGVEAP